MNYHAILNHLLCFNSWKHKTKSSTCINYGVSDEDNWEDSDLYQQKMWLTGLSAVFLTVTFVSLESSAFQKFQYYPLLKWIMKSKIRKRKAFFRHTEQWYLQFLRRPIALHSSFPIWCSSSRLAPSFCTRKLSEYKRKTSEDRDLVQYHCFTCGLSLLLTQVL